MPDAFQEVGNRPTAGIDAVGDYIECVPNGEPAERLSRIRPEDSFVYVKVKRSLLLRLRLTAEEVCEKFLTSKREERETGEQYATRLESLFGGWVQMTESRKN